LAHIHSIAYQTSVSEIEEPYRYNRIGDAVRVLEIVSWRLSSIF
jgi:hypothetical protein